MEKGKSIVISGLPVSGKSTLIRALEKEMAMPSYSVGDVLKAEWKKAYPNKIPTFLNYMESMPLNFHRELDENLKVMFEAGGVIGDSRFISYLDDKKCIKIFVTADIDTRALWAGSRNDYKGMSSTSIKKLLREREDYEFKKGMELFNVDYRNPVLYHAVINSALLSLSDRIHVIKIIMAGKIVTQP